MPDLPTQLERYATRLEEGSRPTTGPDARRTATGGPSPVQASKRSRPWLVAAVAAVCVLLAGVVITLASVTNGDRPVAVETGPGEGIGVPDPDSGPMVDEISAPFGEGFSAGQVAWHRQRGMGRPAKRTT